jgi:hypothetical protein
MDPTKNVKEQRIRHRGIIDALHNLDKAIDDRIQLELLYISEIKSKLTQIIKDLKPCVAEVTSAATSLGPQGSEMTEKIDAISKDIDKASNKLKSTGPFKSKSATLLNSQNLTDMVSSQAINIKTKQSDDMGAPKILGQQDSLFDLNPVQSSEKPGFYGGKRKTKRKIMKNKK